LLFADHFDSTLAVGLLVALWILLAGVAIVRGLSMQRRATIGASQVARLSALLDASPVLPLIVREDMRIECPDRLSQWLGLAGGARYLDDLSPAGSDATTGLAQDDLAVLKHHVTDVRRSAGQFSQLVEARGSGRVLRIAGQLAPARIGGQGAVVLWFADVTESMVDQIGVEAERDRAVTAFESLSALVEAAPFPMWFRDRSLGLRLVNRAYVAATDSDDARAIVAAGIELVEPVAGMSARDAAGQAQAGEAVVQRAIPVTISGARRMMRVVDVPVGRAGVAGFAIDIQDAEDARANFRRFAKAQRDLLDRLSSAVAQFGPDRTLRFANQPLSRLFGLDPAALKEHAEFARFLDRLHSEGRTPEVRDYPAWRSERVGWFNAAEVNEESWQLSDGTHLRTVAQPTPDGGLLLIFEDRTEQVQLASARDTLLRVRTATVDNLFEAIAVFAADGKLQLWNRRFRQVWAIDEAVLAGHPRLDELLKQLADRLMRPAQVPLIQEIIRAATGERRQRAGKIAFRDGRHFEFAAVPLPDGNALLTMLDVSDSRRIEQALRDRNDALEDADRVKSAFLSKMSYELRTPLTSIAGFAEMLATGYAGELPPAAVDYVGAIVDSVELLGRHIDNVLDLSQSEAGTLPIERVPTDLTAIAQAAATAAIKLAQDNDVELAVELAPSLGAIEGDPRRLRQVLDHLLANAIRYTAAQRRGDARVLLHGDGNAQRARLVVSDNGPGIARDKQNRVFDVVSRRSAGGEDGNTGLGLPLSRQLVEGHGGTLTLVSRPGEGTMVTVELPRT
jgi:hypothetical protein